MLIVIGAIILQTSFINTERMAVKLSEPPLLIQTYQENKVFKYLEEPYAVLVLDVSASMMKTDPKHLQTEAIFHFWNIYKKLSKSILDKNNTAHLAVILFSTVAQTVDWKGDGNPWLPVKDENDEILMHMSSTYLGAGNKEDDPRVGFNTDHLAAFIEINKLTHNISTPPVVVLVTDGIFEPHPVFNSIRPLNEREKNFPDLYKHFEQQIKINCSKELNLLSFKDEKKIFDAKFRGSKLLTQHKETQEIIDEYKKAIQSEKKLLFNQLFSKNELISNINLQWTPIILSSEMSDKIRDEMGELLVNEENSTQNFQSTPHCQDVGAMTFRFIESLTKWLQLVEFEIEPSENNLQIPLSTSTFAVLLKTEKENGGVRLYNANGDSLELSGQRGFWSGVVSGGGLWSVDSQCGRIVEGKVYIKPIHEWMLGVPSFVPSGEKDASVLLKVFLVDTLKRKKVNIDDVFQAFPKSLKVIIKNAEGEVIKSDMLVYDFDSKSSDDFTVYSGSILFDRVQRASYNIEIDLVPLKQFNIPIISQKLTGSIRAIPRMGLIIQDEHGEWGGIKIDGVSRDVEWVEDLFGKRDIKN